MTCRDFDVNVSLTEKDKEHALMYSVVPKMGMSLEYLHEYRNSGRLPSPSNVRRLGARLVTILEYIHSAGFLHCDVHTGNVLIDGDLGGDYVCFMFNKFFSIYVIDFSLLRQRP